MIVQILSSVSVTLHCAKVMVPELWEMIFSFPSLSQTLGMFFYSLPISEFWEPFFYSFHVLELWEWIHFIPFPFTDVSFHRRES